MSGKLSIEKGHFFVIPDLIRDPFLQRWCEWIPDQVRSDEVREASAPRPNGDQAARRRLCTMIAVSAAGVTPSMRAACPSVSGRAFDSRSTISRDSPPIAP